MEKEKILSFIDERRELVCSVSDKLWDLAETRYEERESVKLLSSVLREAGFLVETGLAGIGTAFVAAYGKGKPVVGILAEYDALFEMSQQAGIAEKKPVSEGGNGHGCGHHALGAGSLAAALAVKGYLEDNPDAGTVKFFGCPAEEAGSGKVYMARAGCFEGVDAVFTWHPANINTILSCNSLAVVSASFAFRGVSAHAAGTPHLGRSALDAMELMNVGCNFLREHVPPDTRIHYAIIDGGGLSPNIVQPKAEVLYQIRSPRLPDASDVYRRVIKVAEGAALMTETEVEVRFERACSNMLPNRTLEKVLYGNFERLGPVPVDEADIEYAKKLRGTMSAQAKQYDEQFLRELFGESGRETARRISGREVVDILSPYQPGSAAAMGSSDTGDVSWNVPLAQLLTTCFAKDTSPHSWQMVAQGKSPLCHKGLLHAGKVMALAAIELFEHPELVQEAKQEYERQLGGERYICPIPPEVLPPPLRES